MPVSAHPCAGSPALSPTQVFSQLIQPTHPLNILSFLLISFSLVLLPGGAAATRRLVWSRYRLTQTLRDDGPLLTACAFLRGFEMLVAGTASGELKLHDAYK